MLIGVASDRNRCQSTLSANSGPSGLSRYSNTVMKDSGPRGHCRVHVVQVAGFYDLRYLSDILSTSCGVPL